METTLKVVLQQLGLSEHEHLFRPYWEESMEAFPPDGPDFLKQAYRDELQTFCGFDAGIASRLAEITEVLRRNPLLTRLAWHQDRLLFERLEYDDALIRQWPDLDHVLPGLTGPYYFLIATGVVSRVRTKHRELGVSESITRANTGDLTAHIPAASVAKGEIAIRQRVLPWMRHHVKGVLFRIGRFNYMRRPYRGDMTAYVNRSNGAVCALSHDDILYGSSGWRVSGTTDETAGAWRSVFRQSDTRIIGNPISPLGHALKRSVDLSPSAWFPALTKEDPVLEIHIPSGGGMTLEKVRESMEQAMVFFTTHFPDQTYRGFACYSWIMNPRFGEILPPEANLRRFEEEIYLVPFPSGRKSGLYFIFGDDNVDPATAPRDTSIRRLMLDEMAAGQPLLAGGMFFLKEHMPHFGTKFYRRRWPFAVEEKA